MGADSCTGVAERAGKGPGLIQRDAAFTGFGYDIDENALAIARENAAKAGVSGKLRFERRDIRELELAGERGAVICNPPYGERLLDQQVAQELLPGDGTEASAKNGDGATQ